MGLIRGKESERHWIFPHTFYWLLGWKKSNTALMQNSHEIRLLSVCVIPYPLFTCGRITFALTGSVSFKYLWSRVIFGFLLFLSTSLYYKYSLSLKLTFVSENHWNKLPFCCGDRLFIWCCLTLLFYKTLICPSPVLWLSAGSVRVTVSNIATAQSR